MYLGFETVKAYHKRIRLKLEAKNITHSVAIGIRQGWI